MGCDIHILVEQQVNNEWVCINTLSAVNAWGGTFHYPIARSRNYKRFALLAGVRGDGPPPRGLPEDASATARFLFNDTDDHNHSWSNLTDAIKIFMETEECPLSQFNRDYPEYFFFGIDREERNLDDLRIIFWFDN